VVAAVCAKALLTVPATMAGATIPAAAVVQRNCRRDNCGEQHMQPKEWLADD
jgi:hypothetical protein